MSREDDGAMREGAMRDGEGRVAPEGSMESAPTALFAEDLDAVASAGSYHVVMMENERVRVLDTKIPRGHTVPLHTHRWPGVVYLVAWSDFVRRDAAGRVVFDSRVSGAMAPGSARWAEALSEHTVENVGDGDLHAISVEMKDRN